MKKELMNPTHALPRSSKSVAEGHPRREEGTYPLSFAQSRIWFLNLLEPGNSVHNLPMAVRVNGLLDRAALARSFEAIAQRHSVLRSTFHGHGNEPVQQVHASLPLPLLQIDLRGISSAASQAAVEVVATEAGRRPFNLETGPLIRALLLQVGKWDYLLLLTMHHIVSDGWSLSIFLEELNYFYNVFSVGETPDLPSLPIQYADFARQQHEEQGEGALERDLAYWLEKLEGAPETLDLPTDYGRPPAQDYSALSLQLEVPRDLVAGLQRLAREEKVSLFTVLAASWATSLFLWSGQSELLMGTPSANRERDETRRLIGVFINTLALRVRMDGETSVRELITALGETVFEAQIHQDLPFERLVEALKPERSLARNALIQVLFIFQNTPQAVVPAGSSLHQSSLTFSPFQMASRATQFDLSLTLEEAGGLVSGEIVFASALFSRTTIRRWRALFLRCLGHFANGPDKALSSIPVLSEPQRQQVLREWSESRDVPLNRDVLGALSFWADHLPRKPAVLSEDGSGLTFQELEERSTRLAWKLKALGVGREVPVAVTLGRKAELLVALLGIWKTGGAYVPVDSEQPAARRDFILKDAAPHLLLVDDASAGSFEAFWGKTLSLDDPECWTAPSSPLPSPWGDQLAYVLYTSGSTGRPKGVEISRLSLTTFLVAMQERLGFTKSFRLLAVTPITFDISGLELFLPLMSGAPVIIASTATTRDGLRLRDAILTHEINILQGTPATWQLLQQAGETPSDLMALCGGEALSEHLARSLMSGVRSLWNLYGPTEATIWATACALEKGMSARAGTMPLGAPLAGTQVYCLDPRMEPPALGASGELFLGGAGVGRGYRGRPALTGEHFIPDSIGGGTGSRLYRTGDLGSRRGNGTLDFLGRRDHQIKIRGHRIEIGEIEAALRQVPGVEQAAVILRRGAAAGARLMGYVTVSAQESFDAAMARDSLRSRLPEIMIPSGLEVLEALPLTTSGKVDRKALARRKPPASGPRVQPRSETEARLAALWGRVLELPEVSVDETFFDLGGHSLLLMRIREELGRELGVELELLDLFRYPTVRSLAGFLQERGLESTCNAVPAERVASVSRRKSLVPTTEEAVAIVGVAGRFPGAANVDEFWESLEAGESGIHFFSDEELAAAGIPEEVLKAPNYVKARGFLRKAEWFDADFFGFLPKDAEHLDPQQRVFLEVAWEAFEDAGVVPGLETASTGVFAGASASTYWLHLPYRSSTAGTFQTLISNDKDFLATRISYKLNLKGPSVTVQTACSTSLVAVHMAVQSLLRGECDLALAGGVCVGFPRITGYLYQEGMILSPDGHCRAFDESAQGTVSGDGAGAVLLKRLEDAKADGDHIHAILRSSAVNNDGSVKMSYTAPSLEGQAAVIREALAKAAVDPETIGYVEAHGTGTPLGDPIEAQALTEVYRDFTEKKGFCALGSVKSNIGHLDAAAGIAGLIKAIGVVERGVIPPSLDFVRPNPQIDFENSPFFVNDRRRDWPQDEQPRRAAVSSFGIGGTNAHVILEEAARQPAPTSEEIDTVVVVSARTPEALASARQRLADYLEERPELPWKLVVWTLQSGRRHFSHRQAWIAQDAGDAIRQLRDPEPPSLRTMGSRREGLPVAFLFPGQGAQREGMAAELYGQDPTFRGVIDEAVDFLRREFDLDLAPLLLEPEETEPDKASRLQDTALAQPALFIVEVALVRFLESRGIVPDALLGYSVGELSAACISGVFTFEDGLRLLASRGRLMSALAKGKMIAVPLPVEDVLNVLSGPLAVSGVNGPSRCTVSGPPGAVDEFVRFLRGKGVGSRDVETSHAFHSSMMEPMMESFRKVLESVDLRPPKIPFVSNVTGSWIGPREAMAPEYWLRHLREPVQFAPGLETLCQSTAGTLVEVGPGTTLSSFARQIRKPSSWPSIALMPARSSGRGSEQSVAEGLARLWLEGVPVRWRKPEKGWRVALPTYPFEGIRLAPELNVGPGPTGQTASTPSNPVSYSHQESANRQAATSQPPATPILHSPEPKPASREEASLHPILRLVEELAGLPADRIDGDLPFPEAGVDSLLLVQFSQALEERFGARIPMARLMDDLSSINRVIVHLESEEHVEFEGFVDGRAVVENRLRVEGEQTSTVRSDGTSAFPGSDSEAAQEQGAMGTSESAEPSRAKEQNSPQLGPFQPLRVHQQAQMSPKTTAAVQRFVEAYNQRTAGSKRLADQQRGVFADNRTSVDFRLQWKELVYQIVADRSSGAYFWDVDGNRYLDLAMGFGVHLFGHSPAFIREAVEKQLSRGAHLGPQSDLAGEVAASIADLTGVERVTFANTGSEAVMTAIRLARATTRRDKVVLFAGSYHGSFDGVLVRPSLGGGEHGLPLAPGVPRRWVEDTIVLPYGEEASLERIEELGPQLAAVLVEPVQSRRPDLQPRKFLRRLREVTEGSGTALIFDEVITGFRCHPGGAQAWFGVTADIVTYGKVVGGGLPIGVVAGRGRFLDHIDGGVWCFGDASFPEVDKTFFAGTFCKHPLTMASAQAALGRLKAEGPALQETLNRKTAGLAARLNVWFQGEELPIHVVSFGSLFRITPPPGVAWGELFFYYLLMRGVFTWEGRTCFLSTAHSDDDIETLVAAIEGTIEDLRRDGLLPTNERGGSNRSGPESGESLDVGPSVEASEDRKSISEDAEGSKPAPPRTAHTAISTAPPVRRQVAATPLQHQLFLLMRNDAEAEKAYHESNTIDLSGTLSVEKLQESLVAVIRRHDALRAHFSEDGKTLIVEPEPCSSLPVLDLSRLEAGDQRTHALRLARRSASLAFDLLRGPMLRTHLLRLSKHHYILVLTVLHALVDGRSQGLLLFELSAFYGSQGESGQSVPQPHSLPDPLPLEDALPKAETEGSDASRHDLDYWTQVLEDLPPRLRLPVDRPRSTRRTYRGAFAHYAEGRDLVQKAMALSRRLGTLSTTIVAAYGALLHRLTGQRQLIVGVPSAGAPNSTGTGLAYDLVVLPIPSRLTTPDLTFARYAAQIQALVLDGYSHRQFSFSRLVDCLSSAPEADRSELVSTVANLDRSVDEADFGDLRMVVRNNPTGGSRFELGLNVTDLGEELLLEGKFNADLFDETTVHRWLRSYCRLLAAAARHPNAPILDLELLAATERHQLLCEWNSEPRGIHSKDLERAETLLEVFHHRVASSGTDLAIVASDGEWSYEELSGQASGLARQLGELGVGTEDIVAVWAPRSASMVAAFLAAWQAGAAYLPLDLNTPVARVLQLVGDSGAKVIVTTSALASEVEDLAIPVLLLNDVAAAPSCEGGAMVPAPDSLAYVIYTSGSTGKPKGVAVPHRQILSYCRAILGRLDLSTATTFAIASTLGADLGYTMLFPALMLGGTVVLTPDEASVDAHRLRDFLRPWSPDCLKIVPSHLQALLTALDGAELLPRLRLILGGEAVGSRLVETVQKRSPACRIFNHYGPSETTVGVVSGEVALSSPMEEGSIPLGRPHPGTFSYVMDEGLSPVALGVAGELVIGGTGLSRGYLGQPAATAAVFVPDPFGRLGGRRLYRTGDRVRQLADGRLRFLGRQDGQIKIRGVRIELGELEHTLEACPGVEEAAVIARRDDDDNLFLTAYLAPATALREKDLRQQIAERLPAAMAPQVWVLLDTLPRTANGKIDRTSLPEPVNKAEAQEEKSEGQKTPTEEIILGIWSDVLGAEVASIHDDFLGLGGHSLLALLVISRITQVFEVQIPLEALFETPTVAGLAQTVEQALAQSSEVATAPPITAAGQDEDLRLSFGQDRLWVLDQLEPGSAVYNIPGALELAGDLDLLALNRCFDEIVRRHWVLRTTFSVVDGEPRQVVREAESIPLPMIDLSHLGETQREAAAAALIAAESRRSFDLESGPVFRLVLLKIEEAQHVLTTTMHHISSDGWSRGILSREVVALYSAFQAGRPSPLPDLELQYVDYAVWQRRWLQGEALEQQIDYWRRELEDAPELLTVPTDRPRPAVQTFRGAHETLILDSALTEGLTALSREHGATLFMVLLAAFQLQLARLSGQKAIAIGTPVAGRHHVQVEPLIGFFVNTLVLVAKVDPRIGFLDLLQQARKKSLAAYAHQDVPFETLVEELGVSRNMSFSPLFQAMFILQNNPGSALTLPGLQASSRPAVTGTSKFDMNLALESIVEGIFGYFEYNPDLYDRSSVGRFLKQYETLLWEVLQKPEAAVEGLSLLSAAERHQCLLEWNDTRLQAMDEPLLHEGFEMRAARSPSSLAILTPDLQLTYGELNRRAGILAQHLSQLGIGNGDLVGVFMPRTSWMVVAVLGVLKVGAAYVPLSESFPKARRTWILEQLKVRAVLTGGHLLQDTLAMEEGLPCVQNVVVLQDAPLSEAEALGGSSRLWHWNDLALLPPLTDTPRITAADLAYVIFTSGSTGVPKGVMIQHAPAVNLVRWFNERFGVAPSDRILFMTSLTFDLSVYDIFGVLAAGGSIRIASDDEVREAPLLMEILLREPVTLWDSAPAALQQLVPLFPKEPSSARLRLAFLSGDWIPVSLPDAVRKAFPRTKVKSLGGATEATIWSNFFPVEDVDPHWQSIPYGRPIDNARYHVLDDLLEPLPTGVPGDLFIGGQCLAMGYFLEPKLTAWQFIPDLWSDEAGARLYRTGDRARYHADGQLEFCGRLDQQVKIRGFRIELGEIEVTLAEHPQLRTAVVMVREDVPGHRRLVAYGVLEDSEREPAEETLKAFLAERLPEYMVPARILTLKVLPLTANGKLDRSALPVPEVEREGRKSATGPRTETEGALISLWCDLLGVEEVGIHDRFLDLGGDSVLTIQAVARASSLGLRFTARQLYERQTIAELAELLASSGPTATGSAALDAEGTVPLTPTERWFFEQELEKPHHFNQAMLLQIPAALDGRALEGAAHSVLRCHSVLRSHFEKTQGQWAHRIEGAPSAASKVLISNLDLSHLELAEQQVAVTALNESAQASLDVNEGTVFRFLRYRMGEGNPDRLLLVFHHLVIDAVSWRIVLADLQFAYEQAQASPDAGTAVQIMEEGTSFRAWAQLVEAEARSPLIQDEVVYWLQEYEKAQAFSIPVTSEAENLVAGMEAVVDAVDEETTALLLGAAGSAFRTEPKELLVAAVAFTLARWVGTSAVWLELESHGRDETLAEGIDLSRTVGWFTTLFPVAVPVPKKRSKGELLVLAKEALRQVPRDGRGFGQLFSRAGAQEESPLAHLKRPQVLFNYLGQVDRGVPKDSPFLIAEEGAGADRSPSNRRAHLFEVNCFVAQGKLQISWAYGRDLFPAATIEKLVAELVRGIRAFTAAGSAEKAGALTPSDLPMARLGTADVNALTAAIAEVDELPLYQAARTIEDAYALSPLQDAMLIFAISSPGAAVGFEQLACTLGGELDAGAFQEVWREIVEHHDALRTGFLSTVGPRSLQVVRKRVLLPVRIEDWREVPASEQESRLREFLAADREEGFILEKAPLMRLAVLRLAKERWFLVWSHHHLVLDGWCRARLFGDVLASYSARLAGQPSPLAPSPPFRKYLEWLERQDLKEAEAFWRETFAGFQEPTPIHVDRLPKPERQNGTQRLSGRLDADSSAALREVARAVGATVGTVIQAIWGLLLSRYAGNTDVVFGSTVSGRPPELERVSEMVGMFINNLPVRLQVEPDSPLSPWLGRFQSWQQRLRDFEFCSMDQIQSWSGLSAGRRLFDSLVVFQNYPVTPSTPEVEGSEASQGLRLDLFSSTLESGYTLTLVLHPEESLRFDLVFASQAVDEATGERLVQQFSTLLSQVVTAPGDLPSKALSLFSPEERAQALALPSGLEGSKALELDWRGLLDRASRERVAVRAGERKLTYGDLRETVATVSRHLQNDFPRRGLRVAVRGHASIEFFLIAGGVLAAGGVCLPIPDEWNEEAQGAWLRDGKADLLVMVGDNPPLETDLPWRHASVLLADDTPEGFEPFVAHRPEEPVWCGTAADGTPEDRTAAQFAGALKGFCEALELGAEDEVLVLSSLGQWGLAALFSPLFAGGGLNLVEARDVGSLNEVKPSVLLGTSGVVQSVLAANPDQLSEFVQPLRRVVVWGAPAGRGLADSIDTRGAELWVFPTGDWRLLHQVRPTDEGGILDEASSSLLVVRDELGELAPIGAPGELWWRQGGATGHLARRMEGGRVEILGAKAPPCSHSGWTFAAAEVEAYLRRHPTVCSAVVAIVDGVNSRRLVAWVGTGPDRPISGPVLDRFLGEGLPRAMVPSVFVALQNFPMTADGSVDRDELIRGNVFGADRARIPPRNVIEYELNGIWEKLFNMRPIGVRDNFFELGGHSLLAMRMVAEIRGRFGRDLPLRALFEGQTIEQIAVHLQEDPVRWSPLVALNKGKPGVAPLFCIHPAGGDVLGYLELARNIDEDQPLYGIRAPGYLEGQPTLESVETMADFYRKSIREEFPHGPYHLAGHSFGGYVAFEMARKWAEEGVEVASVNLFDTGTWVDSTEPDPLVNLEILAREATGGAIPKLADGLSLEEQFEFLLAQLNERGLAPPGLGVEELKRRFDGYWVDILAAFRFEPEPFEGTLTIFRAEDRHHQDHADDPALGWQELAAKVESVPVPGNHYDLLRPPNVGPLARQLAARLKVSSRSSLG